METRQRKKRQTHDSTLLEIVKEFNTTSLGSRSQGDFDICGKFRKPMGFPITSSNATSIAKKACHP